MNVAFGVKYKPESPSVTALRRYIHQNPKEYKQLQQYVNDRKQIKAPQPELLLTKIIKALEYQAFQLLKGEPRG